MKARCNFETALHYSPAWSVDSVILHYKGMQIGASQDGAKICPGAAAPVCYQTYDPVHSVCFLFIPQL